MMQCAVDMVSLIGMVKDLGKSSKLLLLVETFFERCGFGVCVCVYNKGGKRKLAI